MRFIVKPAYVNLATGYRYYEFKQFQLIDRVKYLQRLGLSLNEIQLGLEGSTSENLIPVLEKKQSLLENERRMIDEKIEDVKWYINYFKYLSNLGGETGLRLSTFPQRWALVVPHYESGISVNAEYRLAKTKNSNGFKDLKYQRQYGYILDYAKLLTNQFQATGYFIYLKEKPQKDLSPIVSFPAGEYLCFTAQVNDKSWDHTVYLEYFREKAVPELIIAEEFEDDLQDFYNSWYEIQMLINPTVNKPF